MLAFRTHHGSRGIACLQGLRDRRSFSLSDLYEGAI